MQNKDQVTKNSQGAHPATVVDAARHLTDLGRIPEGSVDFGPTCLVTGAAGFLGLHLVEALHARGYTVHALDRKPMPRIDGVHNFQGDIRDYDLVRRAATGCRTVFHTAAIIDLLGVCRPSLRREVYGTNVEGTRNVIRACQDVGALRLVHTSSNNVCFTPRHVVAGDESHPYALRPYGIYPETKAEAERAVLAANDAGGELRTAALRPSGIWGSGPGCYMLSKFLDQLGRGRLVANIGNGRALADNTHVINLVHAELLAAEKLTVAPEVAGGQAYFITDEEPMNLMDWFKPLVEALGHRMPRLSIPGAPLYYLGWLGEWLHALGGPRPMMSRLEVHNLTSSFTFRTDKARRDLGYRPLIGRDEGMRECLASCRAQLASIHGDR